MTNKETLQHIEDRVDILGNSNINQRIYDLKIVKALPQNDDTIRVIKKLEKAIG